jgi:sRNA-binding regulator protein Hfq
VGRISWPMPKQVQAEEIERFLGTVDGIASARLLTSPSGEIDQIYATADAETEARAARRAVVAAMMSRYGMPVEPWRVQVTNLKRFAPADLPHFKPLRVEETIAEAETIARVQVGWERAGAQRTGSGQARGPVGAQHRLRTLAAATIDAARAVLDPGHRRIAVHQVSLTTYMDRPLVLVGIAASTPRGQEVFVGAAFQREREATAAVAAALDAVTKWLLHAARHGAEAAIESDRRARLEAMRHFVRAGGRRGSGTASAATRPPAVEPAEPPPVDGERYREPQAGERAAMADPDVLEDLQEIRPQQEGGAALAAQHESSRPGVTGSRPAQIVEDEFLQRLVDAAIPVHIRCRDGYELSRAVLRDVGAHTLVVDSDGAAEIVYKHSIISIRPSGARA